MERVISIETKRYSAFFGRLLREYAEGCIIKLDGKKHSSPELPMLAQTWCTNAKIKNTGDFLLTRGGTDLFGFHDHPNETWAAYSELPFVERLAAEGLIRFKVMKVI